GLFGLLLPTIDAGLAQNQGVLAVITAHAPPWIAIPFFVFIIVGEIWANYLDVYTAGLVTLAMGIRLQRWQTALGCGLLGTALAAYAVLISDFHVAYEDFLILTYLWAPAWAAVVLLSFFVFEGKSRPGLALAAITDQDTTDVTDILELPTSLIRKQIAVVAGDMGVQAAKTGMLSSAAIIATVAGAITELRIPNLVVDPVMVAKGGAKLLRD